MIFIIADDQIYIYRDYLYILDMNLTLVNAAKLDELLHVKYDGTLLMQKDIGNDFDFMYANDKYIILKNENAIIYDYDFNIVHKIDYLIKKAIIFNDEIYIWDNDKCLNYSTGEDYTETILDIAEKITDSIIIVRSGVDTFNIYDTGFNLTKYYIKCNSIEAADLGFVCVTGLIDTNLNIYGEFANLCILYI
jgi:hypothetical protein